MDKKLKPGARFGIWMLVILVLITVSFIKQNNETHFLENLKNSKQEEKQEEQTTTYTPYLTMQDNLKGNRYDFVFTINKDGNKYIYTGHRCDGLEEGYKEDSSGVIKYIINTDGLTYKVINDEYLEIDTLYNNIDPNFLNIAKLFNNLKEDLYELNMDDTTETFTYQKEGYSVVVTTNKENITNIEITLENASYNLEFANVGKCVKIDFNN